MGFLDKIKKKINQGDDDLDELEADLDSDEGDGDASPASSGGGGLGRAAGLLKRVKKLSSSGKGDEDDDQDDLEDLGQDDDGAALDGSDEPDGDQDEAEEDQPIRRSGIAAALDGKPGAAESSEEGKEDGDEESEIPVPVAAGAGVLDLEALFEEEFVVNPTLKDLAESMDDVSATELATDLKTFLEGLQEPVPPSHQQ